MWASSRMSTSEEQGIIVPPLLIDRIAWARMQAYVKAVGPVEINGFGYVASFPNHYLLTDVFITKQVVTDGTADTAYAAFGMAQYHAMQGGMEDQLRLQWHSHVYGDAYHSATDMRSIEHFGQSGMEWFISLVTNHHGDVTARMDLFRPMRIGAPMEVTVVDPVNTDLETVVRGEIEDLVTVKPKKKVRTVKLTTTN